MKLPNPNISYFAHTNFRKTGHCFGAFQSDRMLHTYILGSTGVGKTNLLLSLILQDVFLGRGLCVFDVHGDLIKNILAHIPASRKKDLIYLDIPNTAMPFRYNPLRKVSYEKRSLVASGILDTFQKLWKGAWGVKLEHILRYLLLALLDQPAASFSDIIRLLHDDSFRASCIPNVINNDVRNFLLNEIPKFTKADLIPIYNKIGAFLAHPAIKRFLISNPSEISLRHAMDSSKIVLVNLSKGSLGSDTSHILGSLLLNSFMGAAFSRIDILEVSRVPFHLFLDEFQNYTTASICNMLSELRKFRVSLCIANQYIAQLETDIKNAVLGNVGTIICFRLGTSDAKIMAQVFYPVFEAIDFINLENYEVYLKLMILGKPSKPFSATCFYYKYILKIFFTSS